MGTFQNIANQNSRATTELPRRYYLGERVMFKIKYVRLRSLI